MLYGQQSTFATTTTEAYVQIRMPRNVVVKSLVVYVGTTNTTDVFTIRNNGVNTSLTVTATGAGTFSDFTHSVTFTTGQLMSLQLTDSSSTSTLANVIVTLEAY
jgi:hypothetical protein